MASKNTTSQCTSSSQGGVSNDETKSKQVTKGAFKNCSTKLDQKEKSSGPRLYKLAIERGNTSKKSSVEKYFVKGPFTTHITEKNVEKVIMMVGATGSGKSTLINALCNYILNVNWEDDFRFKLIDEPETASQAHSQTSAITSYTIPYQSGLNVAYTVDLTVIDTPGFGATTGVFRDKEITEQIREFFTRGGALGIDHLDAVGFVVPAHNARLTQTQQYIFDSILSLFGKDIGDNIFIFATFSDSNKPLVSDALQAAGITYKKMLKFNNSALYADNSSTIPDKNPTTDSDSEDESTQNLTNPNKTSWDMGFGSFRRFLNKHILETETKSLTLTKAVLAERHQIQVYVEGMQYTINRGVTLLQQLNNIKSAFENHKTDINNNKNFNITVYEDQVKKVNIEDGSSAMNCPVCKRTCHYPCKVILNFRYWCEAMTWIGSCTVCPKTCSYSNHELGKYKYETQSVPVTRQAEEIKAKYEKACSDKLNAEQLIEKVADDFKKVEQQVIYLTYGVMMSLKKLQEIALKPDPMNSTDYIDLLIQTETSRTEPGWQSKVEQLQNIRKQVQAVERVAKEGQDKFEGLNVEIKREIEKTLESFKKEKNIRSIVPHKGKKILTGLNDWLTKWNII